MMNTGNFNDDRNYLLNFNDDEACYSLIETRNGFKTFSKLDKEFISKNSSNSNNFKIRILSSLYYSLSKFSNSDKFVMSILRHDKNTDIFAPLYADVADQTTNKYILSFKEIYNFAENVDQKKLNKVIAENNILHKTVCHFQEKNNTTIKINKSYLKNNDINLFFDFKIIDNKKMNVTLLYSNNYSEDFINRLLNSWWAIYNQIIEVKKLSQINYTDKRDIKLINKINETEKKLLYNDILEAYNQSLNKYPNNNLVTYLDNKITYAQGARWINNLTKIINKIPKGSNIAILTHRSHYYLLAALSVLNHGSAYVPIDESYPDERIKFMLKDSKAKAVLVSNETISRVKKLSRIPIFNVSEINDAGTSKPLKINAKINDTAVILYTSGTTGIPKGSLIPRKSILNIAEWYSKKSHMTNKSIFTMYTSCVFDMHVIGYYPPLVKGASLDIVPNNIRLDVCKLNDYFGKIKATHTFMTTNVGKMYSSAKLKHNIKNILVAGEKLGEYIPPKDIEMYDGYGPTESLAIVTYLKIDCKNIRDSVGRLAPNIKAYILDRELRPVPFGATGELYLSGFQLAKGYINRTKENKIAFINNPFTNEKGYEKIYKTGDIVRFLPDKTIGFIGRCDSQVKIRGNRVELSEVEAAIREVKDVKDVTVQVISNNNIKELVAYVVSSNKNICDDIIKYVSKHKPSYMIPSHIKILDKIPLNANGKVDKRALQKFDIKKDEKNYAPPTNDIEKEICEAFKKVFNLNKVSIKNDFFQLGGTSITAMQLAVILKKYTVTVGDIFIGKTPKNIAKSISTQNFKKLDISRYKDKKIFPLIEQQLNIYLDIKMNNAKNIYNVVGQISLEKEHSIENVKQAINSIINVHPILASRLIVNNDQPSLVLNNTVPIEYKKSISKNNVINFFNKEFQLDKSLSRFLIVQQKYNIKLFYVFHHIVCDGYSDKVFQTHFMSIIQGNTIANDNSLSLNVEFEKNIKNKSIFKEANNFYENQFCDVDAISTLLPDVNSSKKGIKISNLKINSSQLNNVLKKYSLSENALFTSIFALTLSKFTGGDKVLFNIGHNDRERLSLENSIGMFVRTLPVIINCDLKSNDEFLKNASEIIYKTYKYNFYPFRLLAKQYGLDKSIVFQFIQKGKQNNYEWRDNIFTKKEIEQIKIKFDAVSDIYAELIEDNCGYKLSIIHNEKYSSDTLKRFIHVYSKLLDGLLNNEELNNINYASDADIKLIYNINNTEKKLPFNDILDAFNASLKKDPNKILVYYKDKTFTYSQTAFIASKICNKLKQLNINNNDMINILVPRSYWYMMASLAVLSLGATYTALDTNYPEERISFTLIDTNAKAIIVTNETYERAKYIANNIKTKNIVKIINISEFEKNIGTMKYLPFKRVNNQHNAFVTYTSGSTGKPKGILVTRLTIISNTAWYVRTEKLNSNSIYGMYVSYVFDVHLFSLYSPFLCCAGVNIIPEDIRLNLDKLHNWFIKYKITHTVITTQVGKMYIDKFKDSPLLSLTIGGEAAGHIDASKSSYRIIDSYGPGECMVVTGINVNDKISDTSVGNLVDNVKAYILDRQQKMSPFGGVGELYLSGYQLSTGYINRNKENKDVFINNPFENGELMYTKMYKSGDIVRYLPDGTIDFVGRADSQVKIRGNRVELTEVEACIREIKAVSDVTVQTFQKNTNKELVAYVVTNLPNNKINNVIQNYVKDNKPIYMVPTYIIALEKIPLNVNGKVDKRALPLPDAKKLQVKFSEPSNNVEKDICYAFKHVFNLQKVGINDDFISLGGDSLLAISVMSLLNKYNLTAQDILNLKTPKNISTKILKNSSTDLNLNKYSLSDGCPLSEPQLNIYLDIIKNRVTNSYNIDLKIDLNKYSVFNINEVIDKMIDVHPILKAYISYKDQRPWLLLGNKPKLNIVHGIKKSKLNSFIKKQFDINKTLCRFMYDKKDHTLYAVFHHLIFDGMSVSVFTNSIHKILSCKLVNDVDIAFLSSSSFSEEIKKTPEYKDASIFYEKEFCNSEDIIMPLEDIGDNKPSYNVIKLNVDKKIISKFVKKHMISKGDLYTSVFAYMLSRFTYSNNSHFNLSENGRDMIKAHNAIGMFVNTLPINIDCKNTSIHKFLKQAKYKIYKTNSYNFYPYRLLSKKFNLNNFINFQYVPTEIYTGMNLTVNDLSEEDYSSVRLIFDLSFIVTDNSISVLSSSKFAPSTAKKMIHTYKLILKEILTSKKLSDINYSLKYDLQIFNKINKTEKKLKYNDILEAFNYSLNKYPNKTLVTYLDNKFTYSETAKWINNLTKKLHSIPKGCNVAILTHRSHYYLLTTLAVLNRGCAYVPIDDAYPDERINFMLKDSNAKVILVTNKTEDRAKKISSIPIINVSDIRCNGPLKTLNLKFNKNISSVILYTSGTTDIPKGTIIPRKAIINISSSCANLTKSKNSDIFALYASFGFDVHIESLFTPILKGSSVNIISNDVRFDVNKIIKYFEDNNITHVFLPTAFTKILINKNLPKSLRIILTGGELLGKVNSNISCKLYDGYGPTECTVFASAIDIDQKINYSSIGHLLPNIKGYILDKEKRQVPLGAIGELYLSGNQLAKGYLKRNKENKIAFINNPFDGDKPGYERMYKTGDIVRYLPDKTFGFVGRADTQVKIRGNRVELDEVEASIRKIKDIKDVTVTTIKQHNHNILIAYIISDKLNIEEKVISHMKESKPAFMIPSFVIKINKIPLNVNGKVDKKKLPTNFLNSISQKTIKPVTKNEKLVIKIVSSLLNIPMNKIGLNTNLINIGLDSLAAINLSLLLKEKLNININPIKLLNSKDIKEIVSFSSKNAIQDLYFYGNKKSKCKIFLIHPGNAGAESYNKLINLIKKDYYVGCFENKNLLTKENRIFDIKKLAYKYKKILLEAQPKGPYNLLGWSYGGNIAYEMAVLLNKKNYKVNNIYLLDSYVATKKYTKVETENEIKSIMELNKNIDKEYAEEMIKSLIKYNPSIYNDKIIYIKSTDTKIVAYKNFCKNIDIFKCNNSHYNMLDSKTIDVIKTIILKTWK